MGGQVTEVVAAVGAAVAASSALVSWRTSRLKTELEQRQELWKELQDVSAHVTKLEVENEALRRKYFELQEEHFALQHAFKKLERECVGIQEESP